MVHACMSSIFAPLMAASIMALLISVGKQIPRAALRFSMMSRARLKLSSFAPLSSAPSPIG